ncbi:MAG: GNAT family N-acetyltransferase [Allobaculum sp.]
MKIEIYHGFPDASKMIRQKVFVEEQGFQNEFDEIDSFATHFVLVDENHSALGTCRVFWDEAMNSYLLGRLALVKEARGKKLGSLMVGEALEFVRKQGGHQALLHAQCRASAFYTGLGFEAYGAIEEDEGVPHIWMKKEL